MDKLKIYSQNVFFKKGIECVVEDLIISRDALNLEKLIITDSLEILLQLDARDLKSHSVILFVKDDRYMSLINHYDFHIIKSTFLMTDTVNSIRCSLAEVMCKLRRKINLVNNSLYKPCQVWLTKRELNILMLSCTVQRVDMIANKLNLSPKSVLNYRSAALNKLNLNINSSTVNFMLIIDKLLVTRQLQSIL